MSKPNLNLAATSMDYIETEEEFLEAYPEGYELVFKAYTEKIKSWGVAHPSRYFPKVSKTLWQKRYKQLQDMEEFLGIVLEEKSQTVSLDPQYLIEVLTEKKKP
jgi:hypothetical protein